MSRTAVTLTSTVVVAASLLVGTGAGRGAATASRRRAAAAGGATARQGRGDAVAEAAAPRGPAAIPTSTVHRFREDLRHGTSLKNWDGDPGFWRVEGGLIVGEMPKRTRQAEHVPHLPRRRARRFRPESRVPDQRLEQRHPVPKRAGAG